jgi:hypothetical protein
VPLSVVRVPVLLVLLAVAVLLGVPVLPSSADPFEQPEAAPIRATRAIAGSGHGFLLMIPFGA